MKYALTNVGRGAFAGIAVVFMMLQNHDIGQTKIETDENVKVQFLNGWHDGYVVDQEKKQIMVEFQWGGTTKREVVSRAQIRRLYEVNAMDYGRN